MDARRHIRLSLFLNSDELELLKSVTPSDESVAKTIRRLALKQAEWFANNNRKFKPQTRTTQLHDSTPGTYYDTADAQ